MAGIHSMISLPSCGAVFMGCLSLMTISLLPLLHIGSFHEWDSFSTIMRQSLTRAQQFGEVHDAHYGSVLIPLPRQSAP